MFFYNRQYINNSTSNKLVNYHRNILTIVHIVHNGKKMTHIEALSPNFKT